MEVISLALLGLATGVFGVLVGSGGGIILGPLLLIFSDLQAQVVAGTTLAMVAVTSLSGAVAYRRLGVIDTRSGMLFAGAAVPGSVLAPFVVKNVAGGTFRTLFGLLLVALAFHMLFRSRFHLRTGTGHLLVGMWTSLVARTPVHGGGPARAGAPAAPSAVTRLIRTTDGQTYEYRFNEVLATSFNVLLGFISGFFGTGGGFLRTPVLVTAFGFPVKVAVATSVFALSIYATAGAAVHAAIGHVEWYPTLVWTGIGLLVGSQIGVRLSTAIQSIWILRALVVVLLAMGVRLLAQGLAG